MRRVQFYIEDDASKALHIRARQSGTSVSELVRQAVREKFLSGRVNRREAMEALVGIWKDREDLPDTETYVRQLRKGTRFRGITQRETATNDSDRHDSHRHHRSNGATHSRCNLNLRLAA